MNGERIFELINNMDDDLIADALLPSWKADIGKVAPIRRHPLKTVGRMMNSGWAAAIISMAVAGSLLVAIIVAGQLPGKPPAVTTSGTETTVDTETAPDSEDESVLQNESVSDTETEPMSDTETMAESETIHEHTPSVLKGTVPTCAEPGLAEGSVCSECGEILVAQEPIPPVAHIYDARGQCTVCGAYNETEGLSYTLSPDGTTYSVSKGTAFRESLIVIPAEYNGKPVTAIDPSGFANSSTLKTIVLPNSITDIGEAAFSQCGRLKNIDLPDNIESIKEHTFYNCATLESINLPDNLTSIGYAAFTECTMLSEIHLPKGLSRIDESTFARCRRLISVHLPDTLTSIQASAFMNCSRLSSINLPSGLTNIDYLTFANCRNLTSVVLPDGVLCIGDAAFKDCRNLVSMEIPSSLKSLGKDALSASTTITFLGTKTQWRAVCLPDTEQAYIHGGTVHCSDGEITPDDYI